MKLLFIPLLILTISFPTHFIFGQENPISIQPSRNVVSHSAGILPKGYFEFDFSTYREGGLAFGFAVGLTNRLNLGLSVASDNLLGEGNPQAPPKRK